MTRKISSIVQSLGASVLALTLLTACGELFLMEDLEVKESGEWKYLGRSCMAVTGNDRGSNGFGVPSALDEEGFILETETRNGSATVTITTSESTESLEFDRSFLRSGEEEETRFQTGDGTEYRVVHFGSTECDMDGAADKVDAAHRGMGGDVP